VFNYPNLKLLIQIFLKTISKLFYENNATQKTNQMIKTTIKAYMGVNHRNWDVNLMQVALAIRTTVNESTRYSPFFNTGRRYVSSAGDYELNRKSDNTSVNEDRDQHAINLHKSWLRIFGRATKTEEGV
jgi:hypothetical protein